MRIIFGLLGIGIAFLLLKYREQAGNTIGEAEWMQKVGGVYNVIVLIALFVFLWSIAYLTGTLGLFFAPIRMLFPGMNGNPGL